MWENICTENKDEILKVLSNLKNIINEFESNITDREKIYNFFDNSKNYRDSFANKKINGNVSPGLDISIKDENGAIAIITTILCANDIGIRNIGVINNRENNFGALKIIVDNYEQREKGYGILKQYGYDVEKVN